jgi:hypothetical protein
MYKFADFLLAARLRAASKIGDARSIADGSITELHPRQCE